MKNAVVVVLITVLALFVWKKFWSSDAQIEGAYQTCMAKIGSSTVRIDVSGQLPPEAADYISSGEQSGAAFCDGLRRACRDNFNSKACQGMRYAF